MQRLFARYWDVINSSIETAPEDEFSPENVKGTGTSMVQQQDSVTSSDGWQTLVFYVVGLLYYSTAAINPVIYNVMSPEFRRAFLRMCSCESPRRVSEPCFLAAGSPERSWMPFTFPNHLQHTPESPHPETKTPQLYSQTANSVFV